MTNETANTATTCCESSTIAKAHGYLRVVDFNPSIKSGGGRAARCLDLDNACKQFSYAMFDEVFSDRCARRTVRFRAEPDADEDGRAANQ